MANGSAPPCPACSCVEPAGAAAHAIRAALAVDDLDRAIDAGLLECEPCAACADNCRDAVIAARDERRNALAARERYRVRNARLQRRAAQREVRRRPTIDPAAPSPSPRAALPPAAAAALARAKAKAAGKR